MIFDNVLSVSSAMITELIIYVLQYIIVIIT